jgi:hypothetical protein
MAKEYNFREIEQKWHNLWVAQKTYHVTEEEGRKKFYVLNMFPYPSGAGLHVGHPLGYIASDIAYIVNEAALTAAIDDVPLSEAILLAQITATRSSLSKDDIAEYERMRQRYDSQNSRTPRRKLGFNVQQE